MAHTHVQCERDDAAVKAALRVEEVALHRQTHDAGLIRVADFQSIKTKKKERAKLARVIPESCFKGAACSVGVEFVRHPCGLGCDVRADAWA
jgi:hypothetical protein